MRGGYRKTGRGWPVVLVCDVSCNSNELRRRGGGYVEGQRHPPPALLGRLMVKEISEWCTQGTG